VRVVEAGFSPQWSCGGRGVTKWSLVTRKEEPFLHHGIGDDAWFSLSATLVLSLPLP
jgi:hypothetical protein